MDAVVMEAKRVAVWTKIMAAILHYQNNHRGLSPTDEMIAIEAGLSRDLVRSQMREMEKVGILTDSKRWPRMIKVNREYAIDQLLDVIDPKQDPAAAPSGQVVSHVVSAKKETQEEAMRKRPVSFLDASKAIAKAIIELTHRNGRPPFVSEIAKACGYNAETGAHRVMLMMRSEGWLAYPSKRYGDWRLTDKGIEALIGKMIDTPVQPETNLNSKGEERKRAFFKRTAFFERAKQIAAIIDEYTDANGGNPPSGHDIRDRIDAKYSGSVSNVTKRMVEEGWLEHKRGYHRDYRLTNLGRTALLHSAPVEREVMDAPIIPSEPPKPAPQPRTAPTKVERPPEVVIRGYRPDTAPVRPVARFEPANGPDLSGYDSMDLALELNRRGFRVIR